STGGSEILLEYWDRLEPDDRRDSLQRILTSGGRIRRLLGDLLTATRLEAGSFAFDVQPVHLADVVTQAIHEVHNDDVTVSAHDLVIVQADPARVVQMVTNLSTHATKYGKPPFSVEIRLDCINGQIQAADTRHG